LIEKSQGSETNGEVTESVTLRSEIGIAKVVVVVVADLKVQEVHQEAALGPGLQMVNETVVIVMAHNVINGLRILPGVVVELVGVAELVAQVNGNQQVQDALEELHHQQAFGEMMVKGEEVENVSEMDSMPLMKVAGDVEIKKKHLLLEPSRNICYTLI